MWVVLEIDTLYAKNMKMELVDTLAGGVCVEDEPARTIGKMNLKIGNWK